MAGKFESTEKKKRKKWPWILAICLLLIAAAALYYFYFYQGNSGTPTLIVETPQKLSASQTEDFTLDVTVSALGEARYPEHKQKKHTMWPPKQPSLKAFYA